MIRSVTVYCSSSAEVDPAYLLAARETGRAIARAGWTLVYGGNRVGCMHELAEGARSEGGRVIGITPQIFVDKGYHDIEATELIVTRSMAERKTLLEQRGDAFVALPGGLGTYEELFEQLVNRQLRYHDKAIVALNLRGYFNPLIEMIDHGISEHFIKPKARELMEFAGTVDEVMRLLVRDRQVSSDVMGLSHEAAGGH